MSPKSKITTVAFIAGVRPQFVKLAAINSAIKTFNQRSKYQIRPQYINSGQHYDDMLVSAITKELGVRFDFELTHDDYEPLRLLSNMIVGTHDILTRMDPPPSWVVVFGDTNTTVAAAFAARRAGFNVVHVEAGVRSGDLASPEEINRRIVDHISTVHFCTSKTSVANLKKENIREYVFWTGDLAYDFFLQQQSNLEMTKESPWNDTGYILITIHKPVNLSKNVLSSLLDALNRQGRRSIFVMHPNCKRRLEEFGLMSQTHRVKFIDALPFRTMIAAMAGSAYIITDSGGIQREAYYLRKRCLLRRNSVGWSSFVDAGIHRLIGSDTTNIQAGLDWIEDAIANLKYEKVRGFIRKDAAAYALDKLVELNSAELLR